MSSQAEHPELPQDEKLHPDVLAAKKDGEAQEVEEAGEMSGAEPTPIEWVTGWRVGAIILGMCISLFMTQADSTIASTAIITITNELGGYEKSSWVFTAYLLTYSGLPIIVSRFSDIYGRKIVLITSLIIFTVFSGACGASQTLLQLIMFRWVQGIGGSGIIAIGTLYGYELRPRKNWPAYSAILSLAVAVSVCVAPVIGAGFTTAGQWRWIFLFNVPTGAVTIVLLWVAMPPILPLEPAFQYAKDNAALNLPWYHGLSRIDYFGAFSLLGSAVTLTAALQQAAEGAPFDSPEVLGPLIVAPLLAIAFVVWQWFISNRDSFADPILHWDLLSNRLFLGMLINTTLCGVLMTATIVQIPQRFATVNNLSILDSGIRLLPFAAVMACSSALTSILMGLTKFPVVGWLLFGSCLAIAGVAGFSKSSISPAIETSQYGFQVLAGIGLGIYGIALLLLTAYVVPKKYHAVANGAISQFRILGGSLGLSTVICASSPSLRNHLEAIIGPTQTHLLLERTERLFLLPPEARALARRAFGESYNLQMTVLIGFAAATVPACILMWQRKAVIFQKQGT